MGEDAVDNTASQTPLPQLVHFTRPPSRKGGILPVVIWDVALRSWSRFFSRDHGFQHWIWTDANLTDCMRQEFPEHFQSFMLLPGSIERSDVGRYCILHKHGGIYADLDYEARTNFFEDLDIYAASFVESPYTELGEIVQNSLMASPPKHYIWRAIVCTIFAQPGRHRWDDPHGGTGPRMLTNFLNAQVESMMLAKKKLEDLGVKWEDLHYKGPLPYEKTGIDPVCDAWDTFKAGSVWFRDQLLSQSCGTMPRERALGFVLGNLLPHFRHAGSIHESSPNDHGISKKLEELFGSRYVSSQYSPTVGCGETIPGKPSFSLNLEKQHCVLNESYDIVVTQDVFEHIYDAESAFREIGRTLKPGGFHIPMPAKRSGTFLAAQRSASGVVKLYASPEVHGNPMGGGALLTRQWGYDIVDTIEKSSGMKTNIVYVESELLGIVDAEYREVLISRKSGSSKAFPNIWKQLDAISPSQSSFVTCTMLNESKV